MSSIVDVIYTGEFREWLYSNDKVVRCRLLMVIGILEQYGVTTPFPYSSRLFGTQHNLRELRADVGDRAYRMIYTFDPKRNAVMLLGGDKSGEKRWYEKNIQKAQQVYEKYLARDVK